MNRQVLWAVLLAIVLAASLGLSHGSKRVLGQEGTPSPAAQGVATTPTWMFLLHAVQDPYAGELIRPSELPAGTRIVAAEVEVVNDSTQALAYAATAVRVRDTAGNEYTSGRASGSEPALRARTLEQGERVRGWVWFAVPEDAALTEMVFVVPPPDLRIRLAE